MGTIEKYDSSKWTKVTFDETKERIDLEERAGKDWEKPFEMVFKKDGVYRWHDLRDHYTKGIRITMKKGKCVSIEFLGEDLAN